MADDLSVKSLDFEQMIVRAVLRRDLSLVPTNYYLGLGTGLLPAKGAALSSIVEVAGPGYSRKVVAASAVGWPSEVLADGEWKNTTVTVRFENTGPTDWTAADYVFICDVASGTAGKWFGAVAISPFLLRYANGQGDTYDVAFEYID